MNDVDPQTVDLREVTHLPSQGDGVSVAGILLASRRGPVTLLLEPGSQPAEKLATLLPGLLREARPGEWRLG